MQTSENAHEIFLIAGRMLARLSRLTESSSGKAILAKLRGSIGKPLSETIEVWPFLFENLPEKFLGSDKNFLESEKAVLAVLQLYAMHQQGLSESVLMEGEDKFRNMGYSLKQLRKGEDTTAVDRRFNVMITADTFEEFSYHLRHLLKLLKAKAPEIKVDYAKLAEDMYWFMKGSGQRVRLSWAREYYRNNFKGVENNEK